MRVRTKDIISHLSGRRKGLDAGPRTAILSPRPYAEEIGGDRGARGPRAGGDDGDPDEERKTGPGRVDRDEWEWTALPSLRICGAGRPMLEQEM